MYLDMYLVPVCCRPGSNIHAESSRYRLVRFVLSLLCGSFFVLVPFLAIRVNFVGVVLVYVDDETFLTTVVLQATSKWASPTWRTLSGLDGGRSIFRMLPAVMTWSLFRSAFERLAYVPL
jgi:hypothetical protein